MNDPLSLYIHFPWCIRKCPYCDFNSHHLNGALPESAYIDALIKNFLEYQEIFQQREIHSIFLGGGTPSLFSPAALEKLFNVIHQHAKYQQIEVTLEANPGVSDSAYFRGYHGIGINRISLGAQSFQDAKLQALGRIHSSRDIERAIDKMTQAGFKNFNLDLMYGLPDQQLADAISDLQCAIDFAPSHISWYQLTIEPNTVFYSKPPADCPNDGALYDIETAGKMLLNKANYHQYEVSAYAQTNRQCVHNLNYWRFGDYIGIGAGAHSKLSTAEGIQRFWTHRNPKDYMNPDKPFVANQQWVKPDEQAFEFFLNHWRLQEAVPIERLLARTHISLDEIKSELATAQSRGLIELKSDHIQVTELGHKYLNDLLNLLQ